MSSMRVRILNSAACTTPEWWSLTPDHSWPVGPRFQYLFLNSITFPNSVQDIYSEKQDVSFIIPRFGQFSALQSLLMASDETPLSSFGITEKIPMSAVERVINLPFFCTFPYYCASNLLYVRTLSLGTCINSFPCRSTGPTYSLSGSGAVVWGGEEATHSGLWTGVWVCVFLLFPKGHLEAAYLPLRPRVL